MPKEYLALFIVVCLIFSVSTYDTSPHVRDSHRLLPANQMTSLNSQSSSLPQVIQRQVAQSGGGGHPVHTRRASAVVRTSGSTLDSQKVDSHTPSDSVLVSLGGGVVNHCLLPREKYSINNQTGQRNKTGPHVGHQSKLLHTNSDLDRNSSGRIMIPHTTWKTTDCEFDYGYRTSSPPKTKLLRSSFQPTGSSSQDGGRRAVNEMFPPVKRSGEPGYGTLTHNRRFQSTGSLQDFKNGNHDDDDVMYIRRYRSKCADSLDVMYGSSTICSRTSDVAERREVKQTKPPSESRSFSPHAVDLRTYDTCREASI